jgi:hypothetical protein
MFAFFPVVWAMIARKEMRKNLIYAIVALTFLYTGLVAPTITYSRRQASPDKRTDYEVLWNAAEQASPIMSGSWDWSSFSRQFDHYLDRMFDASAVGFLVEDVARNGFQNGDTMKYAAYAFIPRVLWPNKPNVSRGAWFSTYLGFASEEQGASSTGITAPGELYWNFGLPGILAGMCFIGIMFGQLWRMAGANPIHSPLHLLLYVCVVLGMPDLAEAVSVIAGGMCLFVIFGSAFFLVQRNAA